MKKKETRKGVEKAFNGKDGYDPTCGPGPQTPEVYESTLIEKVIY